MLKYQGRRRFAIILYSAPEFVLKVDMMHHNL